MIPFALSNTCSPELVEQINELSAQCYRLAHAERDAHMALDQISVPRKDAYDGEYTLTARVDLLRLEVQARRMQVEELQRNYEILNFLFLACERRRRMLEAERVVTQLAGRAARRLRAFAQNVWTVVRLVSNSVGRPAGGSDGRHV